MSSLETATLVYWGAMLRNRHGIATPRDFEDMVCLTMDHSIPNKLWCRAFEGRQALQNVEFRTEIPEAARG